MATPPRPSHTAWRRWDKGPFIYEVHTEEGRLRWTHVDGGEGVKHHVDVHTKN